MNSINYPNKTFVLDKKYDHFFGTSKQTVIVAATDKETAAKYINEKLGFEVFPNELVWLMDMNYKMVYDTNGKPSDIQAKILYNTSVTYDRHD